MCRTIILNGEEIDLIRDLSKAMPNGLVVDECYRPPKGVVFPSEIIASSDKESCLCPIDIPATAELNGCDWECDETWNDYTLTTKGGQRE